LRQAYDYWQDQPGNCIGGMFNQHPRALIKHAHTKRLTTLGVSQIHSNR